MFQKNAMPHREIGNEPETVIAASVKLEGDFHSQGNVLIEGVVEGSLHTDRDLRVGERAKINANVSAANATIAGEIQGNLVVSERLELEATAHVFGDVRTKVLVIAAGAVVNGNLMMGNEAPEATKGRARVEKSAPAAAPAVVAAHEEEEEKVLAPFLTR